MIVKQASQQKVCMLLNTHAIVTEPSITKLDSGN